jgi:D-arabinose 1-dehydrogenase-like Zn-dependent alcohol dehydrogenase
MKALCWHGTNDIRCDSVPDPKIEDGRDIIIKVTSCAICGSDLHLMDGLMPTMKSGDILGHEFMGEVIETGSAHNSLGRAIGSSSPSTSIAVSAANASSAIIRCVSDPIAMRRWRLNSSAIQRPACLVTPI